MANFINYKNKVAYVKKVIKEAKCNSWASFCQKLNKNTLIKAIWEQIKILKNRKVANEEQQINVGWTEKF